MTKASFSHTIELEDLIKDSDFRQTLVLKAITASADPLEVLTPEPPLVLKDALDGLPVEIYSDLNNFVRKNISEYKNSIGQNSNFGILNSHINFSEHDDEENLSLLVEIYICTYDMQPLTVSTKATSGDLIFMENHYTINFIANFIPNLKKGSIQVDMDRLQYEEYFVVEADSNYLNLRSLTDILSDNFDDDEGDDNGSSGYDDDAPDDDGGGGGGIEHEVSIDEDEFENTMILENVD